MRCYDTRVSAVGAALLVDGDATDGALFVLLGGRGGSDSRRYVRAARTVRTHVASHNGLK